MSFQFAGLTRAIKILPVLAAALALSAAIPQSAGAAGSIGGSIVAPTSGSMLFPPPLPDLAGGTENSTEWEVWVGNAGQVSFATTFRPPRRHLALGHPGGPERS